MSDERKGCPSASGIGRLQLCPGSWAFERQFPDVESSEATEGTIRHEMIADETLSPLDIPDAERRFCVSKSRELRDKAIAEAGIETPTVEVETRYWLSNEVGTKILSGKFDYAEYNEDVGLVLDYKTLSGYQVDAYDNLQLRSYAVLLAEKHDLSSVYICLVQPLGIQPYSMDMLGKKDLRKAKRELINILREVQSPNATRHPHPNACKWCQGLAHCPEVRDVMDSVIGVDVEKLEDPLEVERLIGVAQIASKWSKRLTDWVKEKLENDADFLPNYKLRSTGKTTSISDPKKAIDYLKLRFPDVSDKELMSVMRFSLPDLTKLYEKLTGEKKNSRRAVVEILSDVIEYKEKKKSLAKS